MEEVCGGGGGGYMEQFAGTGLMELYVQYVCMHLCICVQFLCTYVRMYSVHVHYLHTNICICILYVNSV